MAISFTIAGIDRTPYIDYQSVSIQDSMESAADSCTFTVRFQTSTPSVGNEIIITDGSTKVFAGIITEIERVIGEGNKITEYRCTASDYTIMLNRRYLNKVYAPNAVSSGDKNSHGMIEDILYDLRAASIGDNPVGDYYYNSFYNNVDATLDDGITYAIQIGPEVRQQIFQRIPPSQAITNLAQRTGYVWWIDFDKRLVFRPSTTVWSDFLPIVNGNFALHVETNFSNYYDLNFEESMEGIGTKAIIKDAIVRSPNVTTDEAPPDGGVGETGITANQAIKGFRFNLKERPFSELDITNVRRDRGGVITVLDQSLDGISREVDDITPDDGNTCFIYVGKQGTKNSYVRFIPDTLQTGDKFDVTYNYEKINEHEGLDVNRISDLALATGGDGVHEFVFSKGSEIAVTGIEGLDEIVEMLLDRKSKILRRGSFSSLTKGWKAGQMFNLVWDQEGIDETMWVISASKTIVTPADDPTLNDNIFESQINFSNIPRGLRL